MIQPYDPTETYVPYPPVIGRDYVMADGSRLNTSGSAQLRRMPIEELATKIRGFAKLTDDWDGNGAKPIDPRAIRAALEMVGYFAVLRAPVPAAVPTVHGCIQLGWQFPGFDLDIEIAYGGKIEMSVYWERPPAFLARLVSRLLEP